MCKIIIKDFLFLYLSEIFHEYVKYIIVGFIKCGQMSLMKKLKDEGHEVEKLECATHPLGPRMIQKNYPGHQVIILMRDPIKRMWSQYLYLKERRLYTKTFEDYLEWWRAHQFWFNENPIFQSHYAEHLPRWDEMNPIIYQFEELIKDPAFPHENATKIKFKMTEEQRKLAKEKLDKYIQICNGKLVTTMEMLNPQEALAISE